MIVDINTHDNTNCIVCMTGNISECSDEQISKGSFIQHVITCLNRDEAYRAFPALKVFLAGSCVFFSDNYNEHTALDKDRWSISLYETWWGGWKIELERYGYTVPVTRAEHKALVKAVLACAKRAQQALETKQMKMRVL